MDIPITTSQLKLVEEQILNLQTDLFLTVVLELDPLSLITHLTTQTRTGRRISHLLHGPEHRIYSPIVRKSLHHRVLVISSSELDDEQYFRLLEERQTFFLIVYSEVDRMSAIVSPLIKSDLTEILSTINDTNNTSSSSSITVSQDIGKHLLHGYHRYDIGLNLGLNFLLKLLNITDLDSFQEVFGGLLPCININPIKQRENNSDLIFKIYLSNIWDLHDGEILLASKCSNSDVLYLQGHPYHIVDRVLLQQIRALVNQANRQMRGTNDYLHDQVMDLISYVLHQHPADIELVINMVINRISGRNKFKTIVAMIELLLEHRVEVNKLEIIYQLDGSNYKCSLLSYGCMHQSLSLSTLLTINSLGLCEPTVEDIGRSIIFLIRSTILAFYSPPRKVNKIIQLLIEFVTLGRLATYFQSNCILVNGLTKALGISSHIRKLGENVNEYSPEFYQIINMLLELLPPECEDSDSQLSDSSSFSDYDDDQQRRQHRHHH